MTNYDKDERERQERANKPMSVEIGKDEEPWTAIDVEIPDADFIKIAHAAHTRDITINKMVNIMVKDGMKNLDYRFEHETKIKQLLNEDN